MTINELNHINNLPPDILSTILASSGNFRYEAVCKRWRDTRDDVFWTLQRTYAANQTIAPFMKDITGTDEEVVKGTVLKIIKPAKEAGVTDISAEGLESFIQDLNLIKFYSRLPKFYPRFPKGIIAPTFNESVANQAASIRCWMEKSKRALDQVVQLDLHHLNLTDIPPEIALLKNLKDLNLSDNKISDVTALGALTALKELSLNGNQIRDVRALRTLISLQEFCLDNNQISDMTALGALTALKELSLNGNQIRDVTALGALTALEELSLNQNQIRDVTALGTLTALKRLSLNQNQIRDVTALGTLTALKRLSLNQNQIRDVTALGTLTALQGLDLSQNQIRDVTALEALPMLEHPRL